MKKQMNVKLVLEIAQIIKKFELIFEYQSAYVDLI